MKTFPVIVFGLCSCLSGAQTLPVWEADLDTALSNLQTQTQVQLQLTGSENIGGVTRQFQKNLYWSCGTSVQLELDEYDTTASPPVLVRRYAGDGQTLWSYDVANKRYGGTNYRAYGTNPPNPQLDAPQLLAELYSQTESWTSYMVRFLKESAPPAYLGGPVPVYQESWASGYTPEAVDPLIPVRDPLANRLYVSVATSSSGGTTVYGNTWIVYGAENPTTPTRTVAFNLDDSALGFQFEEVDFAEQRANRFTNWIMTALYSYTNPTLPAQPGLPMTNAFVAYPGNATRTWQPMATVKLSG